MQLNTQKMEKLSKESANIPYNINNQELFRLSTSLLYMLRLSESLFCQEDPTLSLNSTTVEARQLMMDLIMKHISVKQHNKQLKIHFQKVFSQQEIAVLTKNSVGWDFSFVNQRK